MQPEQRTRLVLLGGAPSGTGTERDLVRVATFNINNINKRLDNLLAWLAKAEPDVVSLQELKAEHGACRFRTQEGIRMKRVLAILAFAMWMPSSSTPGTFRKLANRGTGCTSEQR